MSTSVSTLTLLVSSNPIEICMRQNQILAQRVQQLEKLVLPTENSSESFNYLQKKVRTSEENQVRVEQNVKDKSLFCVAIIDAEILGFDPKHLRGGKEQGRFVRQAVKEGLEISLSHMGVNTILPGQTAPEHPEIHLFLLTDAAHRPKRDVFDHDYVAEPGLVNAFYQGFHDSDNCLMIDGDAQLREKKIQGLLDFFLPQPNCRRVFLGGWAPPARWRPSPEEFKARSALPQNQPMPYDKIVLLQQAGGDSQSFVCVDKSFGPENVLCFSRTELPCVFRPIKAPRRLKSAFDFKRLKSRIKEFAFSDEEDTSSSSDSNSSFSTPHASPTQSLLSWTEVPSPTTTVSTSSPMVSPKAYSNTSSPTRPARTRSATSPQSQVEARSPTSANMKRSVSQVFPPSTPPRKHVPGMVEYDALYSSAVKPKPVSYAAYLADVARNPALAHQGTVHKVNSHLPMSKQAIPPCNNYYLSDAGCTNPAKCKFSHYFMLTPGQVEELRKGAKSAQCKNLRDTGKCASGDECLFGH